MNSYEVQNENRPLALEPDLSKLSPDELLFLKSQTGISDVQKLKEHIHEVQLEACKVVPYECIRSSSFTRFTISQHPIYAEVLQLGRSRPDAIYLEFACCFGNDVRKLISDGYPLQNVIVCDLHPEFWDLGHKLFNSTPQSFPVPFLGGDIFDSAFIQPATPIYADSPIQNTSIQTNSELKSLTPLQGRVSIIHAAAFFHLFEEDGQLTAARALSSLLSPKKGSIIFGSHIAAPSPTHHVNPRGENIFCHSPDSWKELWDGVVFDKGTVSVDADLKSFDWKVGVDRVVQIHALYWSVRRL